jgi:aarF domain-containing kinase
MRPACLTASALSAGLIVHSHLWPRLPQAVCEASPAAAEPVIVTKILTSPRSKTLLVLACVRRALFLIVFFGPLLLLYPLCRWTWAEEFWWRWCVRSFERSGALLIKLAQWGSSRPDMFGASVCRRFKHLQDNTPEHPWEQTEFSLDAMFGSEWRRDLHIERTPIGSGCIAQVYRGLLRQANSGSSSGAGARAGPNGSGGESGVLDLVVTPEEGTWRPVAIKVLHPHMAAHMAVDIWLLESVAQLLMLTSLRWLNPEAMLREFASMLTEQLDLRVEASNLERFRAAFPPSAEHARHGKPCPLVAFPEPMAPFVSREVLVESFVHGRPFLEWAAELPRGSPEGRRVCADGIDAVLQMIFLDNFVHGDLHPGNIFVAEGPTGDPTDVQLTFLDAGIAVRYPVADHETLFNVLLSFIQYDGARAARMMAERSPAPSELRDLDGFCAKIQTMVELARDSPTFFDQIGDFISIICEAACEHRVKMDCTFASIALAIKVVEGTVIQVDPTADVAPRAKKVVVREHLRRKGRVLLGVGRSQETGDLLDHEAQANEDRLLLAAKERADRGETKANFNIRDEFRARHPKRG